MEPTAYITNAHPRNSSVLFEPDMETKEERVLKEEVILWNMQRCPTWS